MPFWCTIFLALGALTVAASGQVGAGGLADLLPAQVRGWEPEGPEGLYTSDTLYDLIDGGAEVYRALNVREVCSRRYAKAGAPDIMVDIFDMGTSKDAFGAYHHDMREGREVGVGQESELLGGSLSFWKDRFFVSIIPFDDTDAVRQAVLDLGRAIAGTIFREGERPDLVALLPAAGLVPSQVHYFHDWMLLSRHLALAEENLLQLSAETEGVLARYSPRREGIEPPELPWLSLLLVRYPSRERADEARKRFLRSCLPGQELREVVLTDKDGWVGARLLGDLLIVAAGGQKKEEVLTLMDAVESTHSDLSDP